MPASAEWVLVGKVKGYGSKEAFDAYGEGAKILYHTTYADPASIEKVGGYTRMLILVDYEVAQSSGLPYGEYLSKLTMAEFDCAKGKQRWVASSLFKENKGYGRKHDLIASPAWFSLKGRSFKIACGSGK